MAADALASKRLQYIEDPRAKDKLPHALDHLLQHKVLTYGEVESIENNNSTTRDKVRALVDIVKPKGNVASSTLIDAWERLASSEQSANTQTKARQILTLLLCFTNEECGKLRENVRRAWDNTARRETLDSVALQDEATLARVIASEYKIMSQHVLDVILMRPHSHLESCTRRAPAATAGHFLQFQSHLDQHRGDVVLKVGDVLENMDDRDTKDFMWRYFDGNKYYTQCNIDNRIELAYKMFSYVNEDVVDLVHRVLDKLKSAHQNGLARDFRSEIQLLCNR